MSQALPEVSSPLCLSKEVYATSENYENYERSGRVKLEMVEDNLFIDDSFGGGSENLKLSPQNPCANLEMMNDNLA